MADRTLNVTQLKCAVLDPDWRRRWLAGDEPQTFRPSTPDGTPPVKGAVFHKLAEDFTHWLCLGRARKTARELSTPEALWRECYQRFAEARLTDLAEAGQVESAHHLSQCLQSFCSHLSALRREVPDFSDWQDLFLGAELPVEGVEIADGSFSVSGRVDAVRSDPRHGVVVVDYKLSQGAQTKHDLIQLAIYAHLLEASRPGLSFSGLLEYYGPELTPLEVTPEELRDLFEDMVLPVVDELAGPGQTHDHTGAATGSKSVDKAKRRAGEEDGAEREAGVTPATPRPKPAGSAEPDLSGRIAETFAAFKLDVEVIGRVIAPQLVRYQVRPAAGVKVVSLANRAEDLQVSLALPMPPRIEPAQGCVTIDVPKAEPDTVQWRDVQSDPALADYPGRVAFPIGLGVDGKVLVADLADPKTCHALVAGTSGSGKSEFLRSMAASLIERNGSDSLRLTLIDPKVLTFGDLKDLPHLTGPIISNVDDAVACLEQAVEDMDRRYEKLGHEGFANLGERIEAGHGDLPFHVIIFDEFADLILAGKKQKSEFENLVARLASKGRAAGIHLVLATQRPDRTIVTGPIKANLPLKICLRVTSSTNSQIILDEPGGEALVGRGDLLCDRGKGVERAQSPFVGQASSARLTLR
ncbi:MAG: DNA translocase FtsK [Arenicellales bacterium]